MSLPAPSPVVFCTPRDAAQSSVAAHRDVGDPFLALADGSSFGSPDTTHPVRLSCLRASDNTLVDLKATARSGNVFTVEVMDGTTDIALEPGDLVAITGSAGMIEDIQDAIQSTILDVGGLVEAVNEILAGGEIGRAHV